MEGGGQAWKLCHSNVTTPILIAGTRQDSALFDSHTPVTALVKWVGGLDIRTSYLGRSGSTNSDILNLIMYLVLDLNFSAFNHQIVI